MDYVFATALAAMLGLVALAYVISATAFEGAVMAIGQSNTFRLWPHGIQCRWSLTKQADDSVVTQISAELFVKNQTDVPLGLVGVRLVRPRIRGDVVLALVAIRGLRGDLYGSAFTDHRVPVGTALPANVVLMIRGVPRRAISDLPVTFAISDDHGNEQRIKLLCKRTPYPDLRLEGMNFPTSPRLVDDVVSVSDGR